MEGLYLYAIIASAPPLLEQIQGLGESPVVVVSRADLAAVVSPSPLTPWPVDAIHLMRHEAVVEELMRSRPILPVRFNSLLRTETEVLALLDTRAPAFRSALGRVAGKVEMGLRVLWVPPGESEVPGDQAAQVGGPGTEYLSRRLKEARRRAKLVQAGERLIQALQTLFDSLAADSQLQRFTTQRLLLSGAYLVERDRAEAFRDGVAKAQAEFPRLRFLLTGPWPPYHFVDGANDETPAGTLGA